VASLRAFFELLHVDFTEANVGNFAFFLQRG